MYWAIYALLSLRCGSLSSGVHAGAAGWALRFDGVDDFVTLLAELPGPPCTIEFWVQPLELRNGLGQEIVRFNRFGVLLSRHSTIGGRVLLSVEYLGSQVLSYNATVDFAKLEASPGDVYHYAMVMTELESLIYVDGEFVTRYSMTPADVKALWQPDAPFPWMLGARVQEIGGEWRTDDRSFGGFIDEVRWWSINRSQREIQESMFHMGIQDDHLIHSWSFDDPFHTGAPAGFVPGSGNRYRSPEFTPSPFRGFGAPVVIQASIGDTWQAVEVCASFDTMPDAVQGSFPTLQHGLLKAPWEATASNATVAVNLTEVRRGDHLTQLCGHIMFLPRLPGFEAVTFNITSGERETSAEGVLHIHIRLNHAPVAGKAMAVKTDGKASYALLGHTQFSADLSFSLWVKPDVLTEDAYILSRHLVSGGNVLLFGFWQFRYYFSLRCRQSCNGGQETVDEAFMPAESDSELVLQTGMTSKQIQDARIEPHHIGVTLKCLTYGGGVPARSRLVMYRNGEMIYQNSNFAVCPDTVEGSGNLSFTPWELGAEYDGAEWGKHLAGMGVIPSNFLRATFDDVRFFAAELTEVEMAEVAAGRAARDDALVLHYTFDSDDESACIFRRLVNRSTRCFNFNEETWQVDASALMRFPDINSGIGGAHHVPSPFPLRGAIVHHSIPERSCAQVALAAFDVDGDVLVFRLRSGSEGASLIGSTLRFCDAQGGRRDVAIEYDVCDPHACASEAAGWGVLMLHIFDAGPEVVAFQYLPASHQLRLVFGNDTNQPHVGGDLEKLLSIGNLLATDIMDARWETARALRLSVRPSVQITNATVTLLFSGGLRDAAETSFPSFGLGPLLETIQCPNATTLLAGQPDCQGCLAGEFLDGESCRPCWPGRFAGPRSAQCQACPRGTWQSLPGQSVCENCSQRIRGSITTELATVDMNCICPESTFLVRDTRGLACEACGEGLYCPGGNQPPLQAAGFFARDVKIERSILVAPPRMVACMQLKCPERRTLGTCPDQQQDLACDVCQDGFQWRSDRCEPCTFEGNLVLIFLAVLAALALLGLTWRMTGPSSDPPVFHSDVATIAALFNIIANILQALGTVAELPLAFTSSHGSPWILEAMKWVSLSAEMLGPGCLRVSSEPFVPYLLCLSALPAVLTMLVVAAKTRQWVGSPVNWSSVFSSQGIVVLLLYLPAARLAVLPWQCVANPDRSSSVYTFRSVQCWESRSHAIMRLASIAAFCLFVATPLVAILWAVRVYPTRIQRPGGIHFMMRWRFAFDRFSAHSYGYAAIFLLRNLAVALIPVVFVNSSHLNVLFLSLVLIVSTAIQTHLFPWRTYLPNLIDAAGSILVCGLLVACMSLLDLPPDAVDFMSSWIVGQLVFMVFVFALIFMCQLIMASCSRKLYHIFLSHHKAGAASLARWYKTCMMNEASVSIFLDSDDLLSLDSLFDTIAHKTGNLVVLLTRDILFRPWCVGEVVCAVKSGIHIVAVACNDFVPPKCNMLEELEEAWTPSEKNLLASHGISMRAVGQALDRLETVPTLELDRSASEDCQLDVVASTLKRCQLSRVNFGWSPGKSAPRLTQTLGEVRLVILNSWQHEARTCSFLVRRKLMALMDFSVEVLQEKQLGILNARNFPLLDCVLVLLTSGVLSELFTANALVRARKNFAEVDFAPLMADQNYVFPDSVFWAKLVSGEVFSSSQLLPGHTLADVKAAYERLLSTIAMRFSANASEALQKIEVYEASQKLQLLINSARKPFVYDARISLVTTLPTESDIPEEMTSTRLSL
ncbi:unnamed protein product [Effrenium voratum]|nr:unnamed protein product [Effrenium voratum]